MILTSQLLKYWPGRCQSYRLHPRWRAHFLEDLLAALRLSGWRGDKDQHCWSWRRVVLWGKTEPLKCWIDDGLWRTVTGHTATTKSGEKKGNFHFHEIMQTAVLPVISGYSTGISMRLMCSTYRTGTFVFHFKKWADYALRHSSWASPAPSMIWSTWVSLLGGRRLCKNLATFFASNTPSHAAFPGMACQWLISSIVIIYATRGTQLYVHPQYWVRASSHKRSTISSGPTVVSP